MFPGRSLEVPGDRHPREMIMARMAGYRIRLTAHSNFFILLLRAQKKNQEKGTPTVLARWAAWSLCPLFGGGTSRC
jgi:hypothetical protein